MTKELLTRGCQLADINDPQWRKSLRPPKSELVQKGRDDYARGLAALFLNPYLKSPITVGITGSWGMGKSSLMVQTEGILLKTAAQLSLLPSSKFSDSASDIPGVQTLELSEKGNMIYNEIRRRLDTLNDEQVQTKNPNEDSLVNFLNNYDPKHREIFKSLAVMDKSDMFTENGQHSNSASEGSVPAILTVQYNAWKYKNETEAMAGMAVQITKEIEGTMTQAQWLSTCWRNTWNKKKYSILIEIVFPCLLAIALAFSVTLIVWVMLDRLKLKEWAKAKYASLPAAIVITGWALTKSVMGILKPVSSQLMNYISFPDHQDKLGYQERVISDIKFLKGEIGKPPYPAFTIFLQLFTALATLWQWITSLFFAMPMLCLWNTSFFFKPTGPGNVADIKKIAPASATHLRIIVFVDDLDRCHESVILQVLSAINLVLAVCEIDVVLGMDKGLIERAIIKKYGDSRPNNPSKHNQELADRYLQKIIQLPLDLADPSKEESKRFLKGQLGVFEKHNEKDYSAPEAYVHTNTSDTDFRRPSESSVHAEIEKETEKEINTDQDVTIDMQDPLEIRRQASIETHPATSLLVPIGTEAGQQKYSNRGNKNWASLIPIREMLFVSYSEGEQDAFCYFQELATECRKFPREWKRLLNYHRLVWNIFLMSNQAKGLAGWQVQLITWIFLCWEWKDNMNFLIENWGEIGELETSETNGSSLLLIVEHFIEEHEKSENNKMIATSYEGEASKMTKQPNKKEKTLDKMQEVEGNVENKNIEEPESSSKEAEKMNEAAEDMMVRITKLEGDIARSTDGSQSKKRHGLKKLDNAVKDKLDILEKTLAELKKEMHEFKAQVSNELKKGMMEIKDQVSDELKEIKKQLVKKQSGKNEKKGEEKKLKLQNLQNWKRMKIALERYDVPVEGIKAFQRFRFYCIAGYLPCPLSTG